MIAHNLLSRRIASTFGVLALCMFVPSLKCYASSISFDNANQWDSGKYSNTESYTQEGDIQLKDAGSWGPRVWRTPDNSLTSGTAIESDGEYIYLINNGDADFTRYLPYENRWERLTNAPHRADLGADMVSLDGYIYAIFGGYQREFSRYSIVDNEWEELTQLPDLIYSGAAIETDGTNIFVLRGYNTNEFWRYNTAAGTWSLLKNTPAAISAGGTLVYYNNILYATRGNSQRTLYAYDLSATIPDWTTLENAPQTFTTTTNADEKDGYIYYLRDAGTLDFMRFNIASGHWETITSAPQLTRGVGVVYNREDNTLYVFRGNATSEFWKYDTDNAKFSGPADLPVAPATGADLLYAGGALYYLRGGSSALYKYDPALDSWTAMASATVSFSEDVKAAVAGNGLIYAFQGNNSTNFYEYNPGGNSWAQKAAAPSPVRYGGSLIYPGSGDFLYATRGNTTGAFWKYNYTTDTWTSTGMATIPDNAEASYGARLMSGENSDTLYYISGFQTGALLKYGITGNTWTTEANLPFAPYYGTDGVYYNGKLYITAGYYKSDFLEYDLTSHTWRYLDPIEQYYATSQGPYQGASIESDGAGKLYFINGSGVMNMNIYSTSTKKYLTTGSWVSPIEELVHVASWGSADVVETTGGDSSYNIFTRTSADKVTWSSWELLNEGSIVSPANNYIQVKIQLFSSTDQVYTPVIASVSINYTGDNDNPDPPNTIEAYSQEISGVSLTSGSSYRYQYPYFSWSGAADAETGVTGYYVYFGTSSSANPEEDGELVYSSNYSSHVPLAAGTYYLRIKAVDSVGNTSATFSAFTYVYAGLGSLTYEVSSTAEFSNGVLDSVNIQNDAIKLSSAPGFWQQERLSNAPATINYGGSMVYHGGKLYVFRGNNTKTFYEYDLSTGVWKTLANTPSNVTYGGQLSNGPGDFIYGFGGGNTTGFWRYDVAANTWSDGDASDPSQQIYYGSAMIYDGDQYIYAFKGNDDAFMVYDILSDTWSNLTSVNFGSPMNQTTNATYTGADLVYDGNNNIYAIQGNTRTGFSTYNIDSDSWTVLPNTPLPSSNDSQIVYDAPTNSIYFTVATGRVYFYKYSISDQEWTRLSDAPAPLGSGSGSENIDGEIYVTRGNTTNTFYKYRISDDSWLVPTFNLFGTFYKGSDPLTFNYGSQIIKGGGTNYYIARGNYDSLFVRFNSATGDVAKLSDIPAGNYIGGSIVYDGVHSKIYAITSSANRKLYQYDISSDSWSEVSTDPPPYDSGQASSLIFDGERYIYWTRGSGSTDFYRYDTIGNSGSRWEQRASSLGGLNFGHYLAYKNDFVYTLRGNNTSDFYRYDPEHNTWASLSPYPLTTVNRGSFLAAGSDDYLYACTGENTSTCYRYDISEDSWEAIENMPAQVYYGGSGASDQSSKMYVIAGAGTDTYAFGLYEFVMQDSDTSFQPSGSYTSQTHDLTNVYKFANIKLTYQTATNSGAEVYVRSSPDATNWSDWYESSQERSVGDSYSYKINAPVNRYIQVRINLSSTDGLASGIVEDYAINYYQDSVDPSNPTRINAYSAGDMSSELSSGWYNHPSPYFVWPEEGQSEGASDGEIGSGVLGYYVYFDENPAGNPQTHGTFQAGNTYTASNLTAGKTYYLRIKTADDAGNVAETAWPAFTYSFDNTGPEVPAGLAADPSGYTATDSFAFSWDASDDVGSQGVTYCYKTGATSGTYSTDQCVDDLEIDSIPSYKPATNTFYVRSKDSAGNYSSYATVSYYFSSSAPSPPQNLTVTPTTNTENAFAFSWSEPSMYYGNAANLTYYYSINARPTQASTSATRLKSLLEGPFATLPGENTFYVVAKDEAGNINWENLASVTFTADTSAPGIPTNVDIADVSVKATSSWKLAVSWEEPEEAGAGVAAYRIARSTDGETFTETASTAGISYVDTGLTQQKYYYKIKACDNTNNCGAYSDVVSLLPDGKFVAAAPLVSEPVISAITTRKATVDWTTSRTADSKVAYGVESDDYFDEEVGNSTQATSHTITLTNLSPGTKYYLTAKWTDEDGNLGVSEEYEFETAPPPTTKEIKAVNVSLYSASIQFTSKDGAKAKVYYGKSSDFGGSKELAVGAAESVYNIILDGLEDGTKYYFKVNLFDSETEEYEGDIYSFETLPTPKISDVKVEQVKAAANPTLFLTWTTNTEISSTVTYYPSTAPSQVSDEATSALINGKHRMVITNLLPEATYSIIVSGRDKAGNEAKSEILTYQTASDTRPPMISGIKIEGQVSESTGEAQPAQLIVSWKTDEPSTSQIEFGEGSGSTYPQRSQEDANLTLNHRVIINNLSPSKVYHLRAVSTDSARNEIKSIDNVTITPKATEDALNLVISNLSQVFGFLNGIEQ